MPTKAGPSTSDTQYATSTPAIEPAVSPPLPIQEIFDDFYRKAQSDPRLLEAIRIPCYTTKASILFDALTHDTLTDSQYHENTFEILVRFTKLLLPLKAEARRETCTIPIVMCVDEGSYEEFKRDMARLSEEGPESYSKRLDVRWVDLKDGWGFTNPHRFDKDTAENLKLRKARGNDSRLTVVWFVHDVCRKDMLSPENFMARWKHIDESEKD